MSVIKGLELSAIVCKRKLNLVMVDASHLEKNAPKKKNLKSLGKLSKGQTAFLFQEALATEAQRA
jgi:hypothetical protein